MSEPLIRGLSPDDWPDALVLLEKVFGDGPWLFHSLHRGTTGRSLDHASGAWVDGELVAVADVFLRDVRWLDGTPKRVGCVGSVATHPDYRRQGLSGRLLERSIQVMKETGCEWSLLFTGTHSHYERYGWKTQTLRHRVGCLNPIQPPSCDKVARKERFRLGETDALVPLHLETNKRRPVTTARSSENWTFAVRERLNRPRCTTFMTGSAYAVLTTSGDRLTVSEVGGSPANFAALASAAHSLARESQTSQVELAVPIDPLFDEFAGVLGRDYRMEEGRWSMSRPISAAIAPDDLDELFETPGAHHYWLDNF